MSKKHDHLRSEQNRDRHPESGMKGSAAQVAQAQGNAAAAGPSSQAPKQGKYANDHNKVGNKRPTQKNEGRRTPESRSDRQTLSGGPMNVVQARTGGKGAGRGPRGGGSVGGGGG